VKVIAEGINTSAKHDVERSRKGEKITAQLEQIRLDAIEIVKGITEIAPTPSSPTSPPSRR
jgi:methyl-accepting chemotaxis protein